MYSLKQVVTMIHSEDRSEYSGLTKHSDCGKMNLLVSISTGMGQGM